ncbi:ABC transporter substrate-binding protein [Alsobacter sp. SYSU M60028]|uniref:ABC transporter substrate-binding protein n=1 Tax=Alsobacter ponti TaxID=2962936 RepID=A0ABT1LFV7_9HYPH|nr:ABC transporter substrate-binding protein [Alsobacter ponti]MCP8940379.1 ABC transporter substrate-binding protein [Alsobacter ponti]
MNLQRRFVVLSAAALAASIPLAGVAHAAGDQIRKIVLATAAQAADPQEYQAAQLIAQEWRKLGLDVEVRGFPRPQLSDYVWYNRQKWDTAMWRMVGRPERSDPDELVFNLFHSSTAEKGFNFVGYTNKEYDAIAEQQRRETDPEKRKVLVSKAQSMVAHDAPYVFLVHPKNTVGYLSTVIKPASVVDQGGIGIRNYWTFVGAEPAGSVKDIIANSTEALNSINPLYISGAPDSWITELVWDRLMRIGPDGLAKPYAAKSVTWVDPTTLDVVLRPDMKWHDGKPVTAEDVIFSYQATMGDKAPMYKPFATNIASMEKTGPDTIRFKLKEPNASFLISTIAKINLIPKHVWEPILQGMAGKTENAESYQEQQPIGSGPFKVARFKLNEEIVLERNATHWSAPKMDRFILRIVPNNEASLGMLKRGELNFLSDYRGDPKLLLDLAAQQKEIQVASTVDMGLRFVGHNLRRQPFDDVAFRQALSVAINRNLMAQAAWNGFAVPASSMISPALPFWHTGTPPKASIDEAKSILKKAGYELVGGKLHYPNGKKETLQPE